MASWAELSMQEESVSMTSAEILVDAFGRAQEAVHRSVDGLTADQLAVRLDEDANSIAWLVWHLARVEDDHLADAFDVEQVWTSQGWADRFGLDLDRLDTGYGHSSAKVALVRPDADLLTGYYDAVHEQTVALVSPVTDADLPRIVDQRWTPAVSLGVRLVSVIGDAMEHSGQAAFIRGIVERR
jgi:hypothetical protein